MAEGPELVTNGDFPSNLTGWTGYRYGNQAGGISHQTDKMRVTGGWTFIEPMNPPPAVPGYQTGYQSIPVTEDTDYKFVFDVKTVPSETGTGGISTNATSSGDWLASTGLGSTGVKSLPFTTGPGVSSVYAKIYQPTPAYTAYFVEVDDVSLKEQGVAAGLIPTVIFF
jgi:hypothetical protein